MNNIILIGMKHCGKTSIGRSLAKKANKLFMDLDDFIEKDLPRGTSIRQVYRRYGEKYFHVLEEKAAHDMAEKMSVSHTYVTALGGGTIINDPAMNILKDKGIKVYLKEDRDVLLNRILSHGLPPFLSAEHPYEDFKRIFEERTAQYEKIADITADIRSKDLNQALDIVIHEIRKYYKNHGWK